jgi:hypothetical protein
MAAAHEQGQRIRAEGEAQAIRVYAEAFGQAPEFYKFLRTLEAYRKFLDDKTTLFLPADAEILGLLQFDVAPPADGEPGEPAAEPKPDELAARSREEPAAMGPTKTWLRYSLRRPRECPSHDAGRAADPHQRGTE